MSAAPLAGGVERPVRLGWILGAMLLGAVLGLLADGAGRLAGIPLVGIGGFLGAAFLNLLRMLVVPLVVSSIICGVSSLGNARDLGRLGLRAFVLFGVTTLAAVLVALLVTDAVAPGLADGRPVRGILALDGAAQAAQAPAARGLPEVLLGMIPVNVVAAAAEGKLIGLLLFSLLFGYLTTQLPAAQREPMRRFWEGFFGVMMRMTGLVMLLAPLGVFGLTLKVVAETGLSAAGPLLRFALAVIGALAVFALLVLPALLLLVGRVNPGRVCAALAPALATAFSTSSSAATLPVTLECLQHRAGVAPRYAGFVLPLGTSINHAGSALYVCAAVLFLAQAFGLPLPFLTQATVVLLSVVASMGLAGVPAAALVGIAVVLASIGVPTEAVGVLLVLDRLLDMGRTTVNVLANAAVTVIVARLSGDAVLQPPVPPAGGSAGKLIPTVENPPST